MKCKNCGSKQILVEETPKKTHHAKKICLDCGNFLGWAEKPKNRDKRTKTSEYPIHEISNFHDYKNPFCFFCGRNKEELGVGERLIRDHIVELNDGGEDELENLQILCTACHKMKLWQKTYITKHLVRGEKNDRSS